MFVLFLGGVGHIGGAIIGAFISPAGMYLQPPARGRYSNHSVKGSYDSNSNFQIRWSNLGIRPDQEEDKAIKGFFRKKENGYNQSVKKLEE